MNKAKDRYRRNVQSTEAMDWYMSICCPRDTGRVVLQRRGYWWEGWNEGVDR